MRTELEKYYQIDQYLSGTLTGEELASFEEKMSQDPSLVEEINHQRLVNEIVMGAAFEDLREQMTMDIASLDAGKKNNIKWWTMGLAGVLLTGGTLYFLSPSENNASAKTNKGNSETKGNMIARENNHSLPSSEESHSKPSEKNNVKNNSSAGTAITEHQDESVTSSKDVTEGTPQSEEKMIDNSGKENEEPNHNQVQANEAHPAKDPCAGITITFESSVKESCRNEAEGSIRIYHITGGNAPYHCTLSSTQGSSNDCSFENLSGGNYSVAIKDSKGCVAQKNIHLPEITCTQKQIFNINPDLGESWKIPDAETRPGTVFIYNRAGMIIFKSTFGNNGLTEWNGTNSSGSVLEAGLFVYIIEYSDGKKENGQITISR